MLKSPGKKFEIAHVRDSESRLYILGSFSGGSFIEGDRLFIYSVGMHLFM